ncbi:hypothetical protein [Faecalibacter rhinopitheci]|uniref:Lipoprotein n=1 Tax=Faecalibacter rhinopitheci TaxID=2779678 RepID=A0A8J7FV77_9FLAO|nr:hypothetical protein [Faecalibacter rhinopitheci]MBF0596891.1 hypothetical protein [Faecalibacter rhinopitheci]MBQ0148975.1 hypothetical protein [Candidatus Onthonaster equi]
MKKFFALVAVATLSLGAVSCGEKTETVEVEGTNDSVVAEVVDTVAVDSTVVVTDSAVVVADSTVVEAPAQ